MSRQEFMRRLEYLLWDVPENDRLDAITYYNDYFDEAGPENEAKVIEELGSPERVAETIKGEASARTRTAVAKPKKDIPWIAVVVVLICASPVLIGIAGGLLGGILGLLGVAIGVVAAAFGAGVGLTLGGIICLGVGVVRVFSNPLLGITSMGVGALLTAIGLVCIVLFVYLVGKWIPAIVRGLINGCKQVYRYLERRFAL